ncbi:MAG TPA: ANTAR domain-containing protein [Propionibacteriaceae bacterium]|nr:ANTAR domain-containing protein [Propionibacteriaceae bacterium]
MTPSLAQMTTELAAVIAGSPPGLSTANQLCTACVDLLDVDGAAISMVFDGASQGTYGASSEASRRLDEYQFTFGQGPCLDAAAVGAAVHAPDLNAAQEQRWPVFTDAVLGDGIRAVFALPVRITSTCVGALDLFRTTPGPLDGDQLAGGLLAAELAALPLLTLMRQIPDARDVAGSGDSAHTGDEDTSETLIGMDRVEVYQATGMLIAQLDVDAAEALVRLRAHAIATGLTASEVAWAILDQGLELERDDHHGDVHGEGRLRP